MIIVSVCFVGMMIFAWGMDITGRRSGETGGVVGKINGEEIPYILYENVVRSQREMSSGNARLTMDQDRRIYEDAWNSIITQKVVEQDIMKRKISYTDQELIFFMRNFPPQIVYQIPLFQENNNFSLTKYQEFLNPENLRDPQTAQVLQYIEAEASGRLPAVKFQDSLRDAVIVTEAQVRERWLRDNEKRRADWLFVNASSIAEVGGTIDPAEIQAYYDKHKEEYKREERRTLAAVLFTLSPTAEDSTEIVEQAKMLVEKARKGADFADLANDYSEDPGNIGPNGEKNGGDLGFFGKGRMIPAFEKVAFELKPGEISEPVISQYGCHVIKVDSVKYKDDKSTEIEEVKARHILLNIEPSKRTRDNVESMMKSFYDTVDGGMDFMAQAQLSGLQVVHTRPFLKDETMIQSIIGSSSMLVHRAFKAKKGALLPPFMTDNGYYIMKVEDIFEPGIPPIDEVRNDILTAVRRELRAKFAEDFITRVHARMQEGMSLKDAVDADTYKGTPVTTSELYLNYFMPGLGPMNTFTARLFSLENPGDSTGPVITEFGSGIAVLLEKLPIDEDQYKRDHNELKSRMISEQKNEIISTYLTALIKKADIVDNRDMYVNY